MRHRLERPVVLAVSVIALLVTAMSARTALSIGSGDFQWSPARMLLRGVDAYQLILTGHAEAFIAQQRPNYLPLLFELLAPLGALPPATAAAIWLVLNIGMYAAAAVLVARGSGLTGWGIACVVALLFASGPAGVSLVNGQQTALMLFAAVIAARARGPVVAGVATAVMLTKYSLAPVALVQLFRRRRVATLGVAAVLEVVALVVYCVATGADLVRTSVAPLRAAEGMARGAGDVMSLVQSLAPAHRSWAFAGAIATAAVLAWLCRRTLASGAWVDALAAGALIALVTFPHLSYDYTFLLPVLAAALRRTGWRRAVPLAVMGVLWFEWMVGGLNVDPYQPLGIAQNLVLLTAALAGIASPERADDPAAQEQRLVAELAHTTP